jgi:hypothetical protein
MTVKTYDPACHGLAAHKLQDEPCAKDPALFARHVHSLALAIQETIEEWCFEEPPAEIPRIPNRFDRVLALIDRELRQEA